MSSNVVQLRDVPSVRDQVSPAAFGDKHTLMMRNHGPVTVGKSMRDAFMLMRELEVACKLQLRQQAAGDWAGLAAEVAAELKRQPPSATS